MSDPVEITDPNTGEKFMVHPWIAEHGEWFPLFDDTPESRKAFQGMLPGRKAFVKSLNSLTQSTATQPELNTTTHPSLVREGTPNGA